MNKILKNLFVMAFTLVAASCVGEVADPADNAGMLGGNVAAVTEQVEAIQASLADVKAVKEGLNNVSDLQDAEAFEAQLDACISGIESHIASVKGGVSALNATLSAMNLQAEIASVAGAIKASYGTSSEIIALEKGVKAWLGDKFENFYVASSESARVKSMMTTVEAQGLTIDALVSDVEAGLRVGDADGSLSKVGAEVAETTKKLVALDQKLAVLCTELQSGYESAIKNSGSDVKKSLKTLNSNATTTLQEVGTSISTLSVSVAEAAVSIADLQDRLAKVEADVEDLLNMIQSLTFVSEYATDKAVAYYTMSSEINAERYGEGKKDRLPSSTFDLNFLVRPASSAAALAEESIWNNGLSIIGYYASQIQLASVDNSSFIDFEIEEVVVGENGMVTVTVKNAFSDDFYFREIGAKLALSVESGKTNFVSKFVEITPMDDSGKVYAESITLTPTSLSIQDGDSYKFSVVVTPSNVSEPGVTWNTFGTDFFTVDQNGKLTATKVGQSPLEVISNTTDEWGRALTARCDVNVTPAIKINGPGHVEEGKKITLTLESPNVIYANDVSWDITIDAYGANAKNFVKWTKDEGTGNLEIEGLSKFYNTDEKEYYKFEVKCTIGQAKPVHVTKELRVVCPQPNGFQLNNGLPNDADEVTVKIGQKYDLSGLILPDEARETNLFRAKFESNQEYYVEAGLANYAGEVTAVKEGTANMKIRVIDNTSSGGAYIYPKGGEYVRYIDIHVEPYWLVDLSLSSPSEIDVNVPNKINPVFVSDVPGEEPTYQELTWESLNEDIAEVDDEGNVLGKKEGIAVIKVTSADNATKNGVPMEATCSLNVVKPGVEVVVGEYYFSDGTWGSKSAQENAGKTAIGVIFAKVNAAALDSHLGSDHSECTHGLAVGLKQSTSKFVEDRWLGLNGLINWLNDNGYDINNTSRICGYGNTKGLKAVESYASENNYWNILVDSVPSSYNPQAPATSSRWYVPSFYEMSLIKENLTDINSAITSVSGTTISNAGTYWTSTICDSGAYYARLYDMNTGGWYGQYISSSEAANIHDVRVVLAF